MQNFGIWTNKKERGINENISNLKGDIQKHKSIFKCLKEYYE